MSRFYAAALACTALCVPAAHAAVLPLPQADPAASAWKVPLSLWSAGSEGNNWYIHKSKTERIRMPDEKTAKKMAKKFNRMERKAKKKAGNGVYDDGSEACSDPASGALC